MSLMVSDESTQLVSQPTDVCDADRRLAAAMHVGSVFAPFLVPAAVWVVKGRDSRFLGAHAKSALFDAIAFNVILALALTVSFSYSVYRMWTLYQNDWQGFDWQEFIVRFIVGWIVLGLLALVNMALSLRQAYRAYQGRWPGRRKAL